VDDVKLPSYQGLEVFPRDLFLQGTKKLAEKWQICGVVDYLKKNTENEHLSLLDLGLSPNDMLQVIQALEANFMNRNFTLRILEFDAPPPLLFNFNFAFFFF